ncbi:DUF4169 family protein [Novosphingobium lindaniclasticum]|uniref:Uncharacterized protein n=1 Tax=Novosphingobium lindaniclasticum LE124 TaxID=1096930 RepID=T0HBN6_9SPHN|nr:DUF4169 family protein [Novosphingobium lindaniclasticum]EQB13746.1 hypothetical protein L284_13815 [Novosphingobium lindaniclasticum LE124]
MAEIINLRMARKARARDDAQHRAQASRARHGRTKAERSLAQADQARLDRVVEGAKLGSSDSAEN